MNEKRSRTSAKSRRLNLALCLGMTCICALALYHAGKWTLAEHYRNQASEIIQGWQENQGASLEKWNQAYATVGKALTLNDSHPVLHYMRGYLHEWRTTLPYAVDESLEPEAREVAMAEFAFVDLLNAVQAYQLSLARAPSLPDTWARLAASKLALGVFDEEFATAYANAYLNGRSLSGMHLALTNLSLGFFWDIFEDANLRPMQEAHLQQVLGRSNAQPHLELMRNYDLLLEICVIAREGGWTLNAVSSRACIQELGIGSMR